MYDHDSGPRLASGVRVFGSAVLRVAPDTASIVVAVTRTEKKPEAAFAKARDGAKTVTAFLRSAGLDDFGSSRVTLSEVRQWINNENRFLGYKAHIGFNVMLRDLEKAEFVLAGLIAAGAFDLTSVTFQTTRLKEVRADARRRAVMAAREKADLYCRAAAIALGDVLAIEDANPELLTGRNEGHVVREPVAADDIGDGGAMDPGAISVSAAVYVLYQIAGGM